MIRKIKKLKVLLFDDSFVLLKNVGKSSLFSSAGVYVGTNILNSAIPFLLMPVLTRHLMPEDYGVIAMFTMLTGITNIFIGLSIHGAVARQYYEKNTDMPVYIGNCMYILFITTLMTTILFVVFPQTISKYTSIPSAWLWVVVLSSLNQFIIYLILVVWQVQVKPLYYGSFQISQALIEAFLSITFVVLLKKGWEGRLTSNVLSGLLFSIISIGFLLKKKLIKLSFNKKYFYNALKFGIPLVPHGLGSVIAVMTGRVLLTNMVGVATTGIYTVGVQIGSIITLFAASFNRAYVPWLYDKLKKDRFDVKLKIVKLTYLYFVIITLVALSLSLFAPWFLSFFVGKKFTGSSVYVLWIALGSAFQGMYYMVVNYIFYTQKTYYLAWITFLTAVANVGASYFFIKLNGPIGAAQGVTLSFFILFILTWVYSSKIYKMPWCQIN